MILKCQCHVSRLSKYHLEIFVRVLAEDNIVKLQYQFGHCNITVRAGYMWCMRFNIILQEITLIKTRIITFNWRLLIKQALQHLSQTCCQC